MVALVFEFLWTLPVVGLIVLARAWFARADHPVWAVLLGAVIGGLYAFALSLIVGPMITAVAVPFLPFALTIGAASGVAVAMASAGRAPRAWAVILFVLLIPAIWTAYSALRSDLSNRESFRLVVIRVTPDTQPLHWVQSESSISLSKSEMKEIEDTTRPVRSGALFPIDSFEVGEHSNATVALVMDHDVSSVTKLPRPERGFVTYVQDENGTWHGVPPNAKGYSLVLLPVPGSTNTRIDVQNAFGTDSTEVAVSHK